MWGKSWNANLGDRAETSSYYKAATDAGQLNNIFESIYQEITKTAEYADVTIHDRLSSWVVSSDSASENGEPAGFTYTKTRKGQTTGRGLTPRRRRLRLMAPCLGRSCPTTTRLRTASPTR